MNIVITGAGRGIGLGFVEYYLAKKENVWACYRSNSDRLNRLHNEQLKRVCWDVSEELDEGGVQRLGLPDKIDLLINNAGIYGPKKAAGQSLESVSAQTMMEVFSVNCVGPLNVAKSLSSRVVAAKGKIANLSSKMGSSGDNSSGGCYAYRASKAALINISKSMAIDLEPDGVNVITLHPGWVRTDMTNHNGLIDIETAVNGMADVIENIGDYIPGSFVAFDGKLIPY